MDKYRQDLIIDNLEFARWLAHKWADTQHILDYEELESLAMLGLTMAAKNYDVERKTKFSTYAKIVIENSFRNAYKKERRKIDTIQPLLDEKDADSFRIEEASIFRKVLEDNLTEEERETLLLAYEYGYSQREIALMKGVSQTKVNTIIKKAKDKIAQELEMEE